MRDCELVQISTQNFELICAQHPKVALKLTKSIARRSLNRASTAHSSTQLMSQARANERIAGHSQTANLATLAVMPVNSESQTGTDALVSLLGDELRKFGAVLILDDVAIAEVLGEETLTTMHLPFYKTRVASWIVQQEEDYRFVIMKGNLGNPAWYTNTHTHTHTHTHTYIHALICTMPGAEVYIHIYMYTHTHTHTPAGRQSVSARRTRFYSLPSLTQPQRLVR